MMLQVNNLQPTHGSKHHYKRLGRGNASGKGNCSGRGGKGQTARSGGGRGLSQKAFKPLLQSTPKLPGFRSFKIKPAEVYLNALDKSFKDGDEINLVVLKEKGLVGKNKKTAKILSTGEITKKLIVVGILVTKAAKDKIEKAGGSVK